MADKRLGFALCGSFCTFSEVIPVMHQLAGLGYTLIPIMSEYASSEDTRFGSAESIKKEIVEICGHNIVTTISGSEPFGSTEPLDMLLVAPCTGNTLGKLTGGITDTAVTMAAKAHLRNSRPLVLAISTNDALSASAKNIGELLNRKNVYFVPFRQDAPLKKPFSCASDFTLIPAALEEAALGKQLQPILLGT
jgi:dipicolinate synthase subunit B